MIRSRRIRRIPTRCAHGVPMLDGESLDGVHRNVLRDAGVRALPAHRPSWHATRHHLSRATEVRRQGCFRLAHLPDDDTPRRDAFLHPPDRTCRLEVRIVDVPPPAATPAPRTCKTTPSPARCPVSSPRPSVPASSAPRAATGTSWRCSSPPPPPAGARCASPSLCSTRGRCSRRARGAAGRCSTSGPARGRGRDARWRPRAWPCTRRKPRSSRGSIVRALARSGGDVPLRTERIAP